MIRKLIDCASLYVGGPISLGGTLPPERIEDNLARFYAMETGLQRMGFAVFNPARLPKHNRNGEAASQEDYLEQCVWMLMQAEGMVALDGWADSAGTLREILIVQATGKPVFDETFAPLAEQVVPHVLSPREAAPL